MGGRKFSSSELQLLILRLLSDGPAHGYQLIRRLEELSQGFYAPSPGVIYPALTYLDEIGQAEARQDGKRKLYALTDDGRGRLNHHRANAEGLIAALEQAGSRMDRMREAWAETDPALADERHRAHMALKSAIRARMGCGPDEVRRITEILNNAAAQILNIPANTPDSTPDSTSAKDPA